MKKNFFKQLACVLSLAMVVTTAAPAGNTAAAASTKLTLNKTSKVLYLDKNASAKAVGNTFNFDVKGVTDSKCTWTSSNKSIATVDKNGKVTPKAVGSATITVKYGKKSAKAKVTVRANADKITIKNAPKTKKVAAGAVFDFDRTITYKGKKATSKTYWEVVDDATNPAGATVEQSTGKVTTTKVGKYTITAHAYQNSTEKAAKRWTASSEAITIEAVPAVKSVAQESLNKVEITFGVDVKDVVKAGDLTITDSYGTNQVVKSLTFSTDGKVATAETYLNLADKMTYTVAYGDTKQEFVASVGDVASMVVTGRTVQYSTPTTMDIRLLDANGIDVTTADKIKDNVTFDYDTAKAWIEYNTTDNAYKINVYNIGATADVKATYHTYTYSDKGTEVVFESPVAKFNAVEELKDTGVFSAYTVVKTGTTPDWSKVNHNIAAESSDMQFVVKGTRSDGTDFQEGDLKFESTNTDILIVDATNGNLYPVKEGTAYIKVTYGSTVQTFAVTVGSPSKATSIVADKTSVIASNGLDTDKVTVKLTVKDQYGNDITSGVPTYELLNSTASNTDPTVTAEDGGKVTFNTTKWDKTASTGTKAGTYKYKLMLQDKSVVVTVTVREPGKPASKRIFLSQSTVDAKITAGTEQERTDKNVCVEVYNVDNSGVKVSKVDLSSEGIKVTNPDGKEAGTVTDAGMYIDDKKGFNPIQVKADQSWVQAKAGTYRVTASGITTTFQVVNTQTMPSYTVQSVTSTASNVLHAVNECFKFRIGATTVTAGAVEFSAPNGSVDNKGEAQRSNVSVYIKSAVVNEVIDHQTVQHIINIGRSIVINKN